MTTTINDIEFIIPCAGTSSRNYPHSKGLPHKALLPFGSYRLIDHILKDIFQVGGRHITIICSDGEVIDFFKKAFEDDSKMRGKLTAKGRDDVSKILEKIEIPEDADIKYAIQDQVLGTAQVLSIAHEISSDRHGIMIFPDDIYISKDENNCHLQKLINKFLKNDKQILITGQKREDVSNNSIIQDGRLIEKPTNPTTNIGGFSPMTIPKAVLDHIQKVMKQFIVEGKEWIYTDGINDFLDNAPNASQYTLAMPLKDEEDLYRDVGTLPFYESALLESLFLISQDKEKHIELAKKYIK